MRAIVLTLLSLILIHCAPSTESTQNVGAYAHSYLASDQFTSLVVEIQYVQGYAPTSASMTALQNFLTARLNKPGGITFVTEAIPSPGLTSYSVSDIKAIETQNRVHYSSGAQIVAYYLFLDGHSSSDTSSGKILGEAYDADSLAMFEATMMSLTGGFGQPSLQTVETTVAEHEFGHILGLVNVGTGMQTTHQDTAHGAHCTATACLMYWEVETSSSLSNLGGGSVPTLDADCIADLRANGGK